MKLFWLLMLIFMLASPMAIAIQSLQSWKRPHLPRSARVVLAVEVFAFCVGMIFFWSFFR